MKIVLLPGVGVQTDTSTYEAFLDNFRVKFECEAEVFVWEHGDTYPVHNLPMRKTREWVVEVMLDFQKVITEAMTTSVPDADLYIGHSAGSILALVQKKPCIIFGSPATIVGSVNEHGARGLHCQKLQKAMQPADRPVLNIINRYDLLAYPLIHPNVENYEYVGSRLNPLSYFPISTHIGYWKSKKVSKKIIKTIDEWKKKNIV